MISFGAPISEGVGDDKGLEARQRLERHLCDLTFFEFLDVHAAHMGQRHRRSAELSRIGHGEIDFTFSRNAASKVTPFDLAYALPAPLATCSA